MYFEILGPATCDIGSAAPSCVYVLVDRRLEKSVTNKYVKKTRELNFGSHKSHLIQLHRALSKRIDLKGNIKSRAEGGAHHMHKN